jgi:Fe-S cluster biogenesis protein NfuA
MTDAATARVTVLAEHTPNPDSVKFAVLDLAVCGDSVEFSSPAGAEEGSPLAARLFGLGGVARVFVGQDFVTVTREPGVDWRALGPRVAKVVKAHLEAGKPALTPGWSPPLHASDAQEPRIRAVIEREIRPMVARDGGDVRFVCYRGGVLEVELRGACAGCPRSQATLRGAIERRLRDLVPGLRRVVSSR